MKPKPISNKGEKKITTWCNHNSTCGFCGTKEEVEKHMKNLKGEKYTNKGKKKEVKKGCPNTTDGTHRWDNEWGYNYWHCVACGIYK